MKARPIPAATRAAVLDRDHHLCLRCGRCICCGPYSLQHRRPRRMGGSTAPHGLANLATLCGTATSPNDCHEAVERQRLASMAEGWLISQFDRRTPSGIPLRTFMGWVLLTDDGRIEQTTAPTTEGVPA